MQNIHQASPTLADILRSSAGEPIVKENCMKTPTVEQSPAAIDVQMKIHETHRISAPPTAYRHLISMFDMMESDNNQDLLQANGKYCECVIKEEPRVIILEPNMIGSKSEGTVEEQFFGMKNPQIVLKPVDAGLQDNSLGSRKENSTLVGPSDCPQKELTNRKKLTTKKQRRMFLKNFNARKAAERAREKAAQSTSDTASASVMDYSNAVSNSEVNGTKNRWSVVQKHILDSVISVVNKQRTKTGKENEPSASIEEPEILICGPEDGVCSRVSTSRRTAQDEESPGVSINQLLIEAQRKSHASTTESNELFLLKMQLNAYKRDNEDLKKILVTQSESTAELNCQIVKLRAEVELWRTLFEEERLERANDNRRAKRAVFDRIRHLNEQLENANKEISSLESIGGKLSCDFDDVNQILKAKSHGKSPFQSTTFVNNCRLEGERSTDNASK